MTLRLRVALTLVAVLTPILVTAAWLPGHPSEGRHCGAHPMRPRWPGWRPAVVTCAKPIRFIGAVHQGTVRGDLGKGGSGNDSFIAVRLLLMTQPCVLHIREHQSYPRSCVRN